MEPIGGRFAPPAFALRLDARFCCGYWALLDVAGSVFNYCELALAAPLVAYCVTRARFFLGRFLLEPTWNCCKELSK